MVPTINTIRRPKISASEDQMSGPTARPSAGIATVQSMRKGSQSLLSTDLNYRKGGMANRNRVKKYVGPQTSLTDLRGIDTVLLL